VLAAHSASTLVVAWIRGRFRWPPWPAHPWPGNVRELQNVVERAFALSNTDTLDVSDLPPLLTATPSPAETASTVPTLEDAERALIARALELSGGNKNEAARRLGIDRQRLYRKIARHGL
jgi:transcriptional regulator of acetoin/glycerol metabolism